MVALTKEQLHWPLIGINIDTADQLDQRAGLRLLCPRVLSMLMPTR
ncbi:hypothetical protein [Rhizobium calliandrae]